MNDSKENLISVDVVTHSHVYENADFDIVEKHDIEKKDQLVAQRVGNIVDGTTELSEEDRKELLTGLTDQPLSEEIKILDPFPADFPTETTSIQEEYSNIAFDLNQNIHHIRYVLILGIILSDTSLIRISWIYKHSQL